MTAIEKIQIRIKELYESKTKIHITITLSHPRIYLNNAPAVITGVYPHVFRVEILNCENKNSHTLQYSDLLTSSVKIEEM